MSVSAKAEAKQSLIKYSIGFLLSLVCTMLAFMLVLMTVEGYIAMPSEILIPLIGLLAFGQFIVQLVYFLHLGTERKPRWKLLVFWFMIIIVAIIVVGSIWIMDNLNYNMMGNPEKTQEYIDKNQGF